MATSETGQEPAPPPLRIAVLSRYALVRAGITHLANVHPEVAVVVDTANHDGHLGGLDVVIYDLAGLSDPGTRADLQHLLGSARVLGLARDGRDDLTDGARALGVRHIVTERVDPDELAEALMTAADRPGPAPRRDPAALNAREREILALVATGVGNDEIAQDLFVSVNTVKSYIRTAYRKIGVHTRAQAVRWVITHGLASDGRRDHVSDEDDTYDDDPGPQPG